MLQLPDETLAACSKLKEYFVFYPDFPKSGIKFWDVFSLMKNPEAFKLLQFILSSYADTLKDEVDVIVGVESRGFLFGPWLAYLMNCTFVPLRKKGKLPGETKSISYLLEYGEDILEIQKDSINAKQKVIIVDDCIATGGTLRAACKLINNFGAKVVECMLIYNVLDSDDSMKEFPAPVRLLCK